MRKTLLDITSRLTSTLWQDGGQRRARLNARQAMVADAVRTRARVEAELAPARTAVTAGARGGRGAGRPGTVRGRTAG